MGRVPPPPPTPPLFTSLSCFCRLLSLRPLVWNSTYLNNVFPNPNLSHTLMWFHPMEWNLLPSSSFHIHLKSSFLKSSDFSPFTHIFPSFRFSFILQKKKKISVSQPTSISTWLPRLVSGSYWSVSYGKKAESSPQNIFFRLAGQLIFFFRAWTIWAFWNENICIYESPVPSIHQKYIYFRSRTWWSPNKIQNWA